MSHVLQQDHFFSNPALKGPIFISVFFHIAVVLAGTMSLPYLKKDRPIIPESIAIDIVEIDEIAQTDKPPVPKKIEPEVKLEEPEPPKKENKPPVAPKVVAKAPPKVVMPKPPQLKEEVSEPPKTVPPPSTEKLKEPPKPKKPPKETEIKQEEAFSSLLANLQESEPVSEAEGEKKTQSIQSPLARLSNQMTATEFQALRNQLAGCWKIPAGARNAEELSIEVRVIVNPDRTVRKADIVDMWRYNNDSFFRAAADSARQAVYSPLCSPLDLPADKYDQWKDMIINFNPSEML